MKRDLTVSVLGSPAGALHGSWLCGVLACILHRIDPKKRDFFYQHCTKEKSQSYLPKNLCRCLCCFVFMHLLMDRAYLSLNSESIYSDMNFTVRIAHACAGGSLDEPLMMNWTQGADSPLDTGSANSAFIGGLVRSGHTVPKLSLSESEQCTANYVCSILCRLDSFHVPRSQIIVLHELLEFEDYIPKNRPKILECLLPSSGT